MAIILTTPINNVGSVTSTIVDTIPANSTKVVDVVDTTLYRNFKWIVSITDTINQMNLTQEVSASYNSTNLRYSRYSLIGDLIPHLLTVQMHSDGETAQLQVSNTSSNQYTTKIFRQFSLA